MTKKHGHTQAAQEIPSSEPTPVLPQVAPRVMTADVPEAPMALSSRDISFDVPEPEPSDLLPTMPLRRRLPSFPLTMGGEVVDLTALAAPPPPRRTPSMWGAPTDASHFALAPSSEAAPVSDGLMSVPPLSFGSHETTPTSPSVAMRRKRRPRGAFALVASCVGVAAVGTALYASRERTPAQLSAPVTTPASLGETPALARDAVPAPTHDDSVAAAPIELDVQKGIAEAGQAPVAIDLAPAATTVDSLGPASAPARPAAHARAIDAMKIDDTPASAASAALTTDDRAAKAPGEGASKAPAEGASKAPGEGASNAPEVTDLDEPVAGPPFDKDAAAAAIGGLSSRVATCFAEPPGGSVRVAITFAPTGKATLALVEGGPFAGTPEGSCVARLFQSASVPPFAGGLVTIHKTVALPLPALRSPYASLAEALRSRITLRPLPLVGSKAGRSLQRVASLLPVAARWQQRGGRYNAKRPMVHALHGAREPSVCFAVRNLT